MDKWKVSVYLASMQQSDKGDPIIKSKARAAPAIGPTRAVYNAISFSTTARIARQRI
jgi:hypothetical protein